MKNSEDFSLFTSIGDLLSDGIVLYDLKQQRVVYINAAGIDMTGVQRNDSEEQIEHFWQQILLPDRAYLNAQYNSLLKEHTSRSAEFGLLRSRHEKRHLHATGCVVQSRSLLAVFLRDITQLKEHEDYLVEFGAKKNTLLDTLTHNLSGSLNLAKHLALQAEKHSDKTPGELNTFLKLITENNGESLKIVEDFLLYEHSKSPRIHIKKVRIDLIEKVGYIHQQLKYSYPDRIFELTSVQPELQITTDEVKLLQVVNNLVSNAIKFSPADQVISIHIEGKTDHVVISVADRGIGIPESLKPLIFLRQPSTGRIGLNGEASNGQGLSICKHLVSLMEGEISFESTEGAGTTFTISLPYDMNNADGELGLSV